MENVIEKQVEIAAPLSRVWRALTDAREFGAWFDVNLEGPFVAGQPAGGLLTIKGYEHVRMDVVVEAIEPETLFSYRWHPFAIDPTVDYSGEPMTLVEFRLSPMASGTRLTVTESGFEKIPAARRAEAFAMNEHGWAAQMDSIKAYVDTNP